MLTKEEADKIAKIEGEVRAAVLQTDAEYVRKKNGRRRA